MTSSCRFSPPIAIIRDSVEKAIKFGKPGRIIVDLSSTAPHIIQEMYEDAKKAGMFLLDSPVSGGNPMAIAGTLAIMTGGDKEAFDKVKPLLACMGSPVYTGGPASGSVTKLVNNIIGGAIPGGHCGGLCLRRQGGHRPADHLRGHPRRLRRRSHAYDNKVPKIIKRDYEPRRSDRRPPQGHPKRQALCPSQLGVDTPLTDVVLHGHGLDERQRPHRRGPGRYGQVLRR